MQLVVVGYCPIACFIDNGSRVHLACQTATDCHSPITICMVPHSNDTKYEAVFEL